MRRLGIALLAIAALTVGACEDLSVDPDSIRGSYSLTAVNDDPLPAVMFEGELDPFGHVVARALSGSMQLGVNTYTERVVVELEYGGTTFEGEPIESTGEYSVSGQLITFEPDDPDQADFSGTLQGGVLHVTEVDPEFGSLSLTFER